MGKKKTKKKHRVSATPPTRCRWRKCCEHVDSDDPNERGGLWPDGDFHNQDDGAFFAIMRPALSVAAVRSVCPALRSGDHPRRSQKERTPSRPHGTPVQPAKNISPENALATPQMPGQSLENRKTAHECRRSTITSKCSNFIPNPTNH